METARDTHTLVAAVETVRDTNWLVIHVEGIPLNSEPLYCRGPRGSMVEGTVCSRLYNDVVRV